MTEPDGGAPVAESRCPWCSGAVPDGAERCPSCGATLREARPSGEADIPGVTQVDPVLGMRRQLPRPNRLVGWLADVDTEPAPTLALTVRSGGGSGPELGAPDAGSVAPPSEDVRREIRRLQIEALKAELEGRVADARVAALDAGLIPPGAVPGAESPAGSEAPAPEAHPAEPTPVEPIGAEPPSAEPDGPDDTKDGGDPRQG